MAIFGRRTTRRHRQRAAHRPPAAPRNTGEADCTQRVVGGLWPAEIPQTATAAAHLRADLWRIVDSANERLRQPDHAGPAEQQKVIEGARRLAVLRVESAVRGIYHQTPANDRECRNDTGAARLHRLLVFVARQQPELRWAVGDRGDGTTIIVTDLAHGWIPPGIAVPAGVCLRPPGRHAGGVAALLGPTTVAAAYAPGDPLGPVAASGGTEPSLRPRELPTIDNLARLLAEAVGARAELPTLTQTLAAAGITGTRVLDAEIDLLRVHLDTAHYSLLAQYPAVEAALLLDFLLLAATEAIVTGDTVSARYHFAWSQALGGARSKTTADDDSGSPRRRQA